MVDWKYFTVRHDLSTLLRQLGYLLCQRQRQLGASLYRSQASGSHANLSNGRQLSHGRYQRDVKGIAQPLDEFLTIS